MMRPIVRMFNIGIVCGIGLCNLLWMIVDFHPVSLGVASFSMVILTFLYIDSRCYYAEVQS